MCAALWNEREKLFAVQPFAPWRCAGSNEREEWLFGLSFAHRRLCDVACRCAWSNAVQMTAPALCGSRWRALWTCARWENLSRLHQRRRITPPGRARRQRWGIANAASVSPCTTRTDECCRWVCGSISQAQSAINSSLALARIVLAVALVVGVSCPLWAQTPSMTAHFINIG